MMSRNQVAEYTLLDPLNLMGEILFATNSLVLFLCQRTLYFSNHTAHAVLFSLSANMVRHLGYFIRHTYRERTRTNSLNIDSRHGSLKLSYRLGCYSPQ